MTRLRSIWSIPETKYLAGDGFPEKTLTDGESPLGTAHNRQYGLANTGYYIYYYLFMSTFYRVFKTERKWYSVLLIKVAQLCRIDGLVITPANNAFLSLSRMVVDT